MYCTDCGNYIGDCRFCSDCGKAVEDFSGFNNNSYTPPLNGQHKQGEARLPEKEKENENEKMFFGKKALTFCLTVIALLSITSGILFGLYIFK
jgi:uncharacterized membrane protein YvbJ